jgi:nucleoside-diphosphate-sugar epimerase
MANPHLLCLGMGYSALHIARRLSGDGWQVTGTCRTEQKAAALHREGFGALVFDGEQPSEGMMDALQGVTHLLCSIPPDKRGDPAISHHGADMAGAVHQLAWIGYLSTIGVYGDRGCDWVDEDTPTAPVSDSSRFRVAAENQWLELGAAQDIPTCLFRLPGIYGPGGRNQIDALRAGKARRIVKPGQVFNRIHVDDLATAVIAAMHAPGKAGIYNLADDEPAPADEVVTYAARLLGIEPPPEVAFAEARLPPFAAHFYAECKRVRNHRMKQQLGVELRYPTYREGLASTLEPETSGKPLD